MGCRYRWLYLVWSSDKNTLSMKTKLLHNCLIASRHGAISGVLTGLIVVLLFLMVSHRFGAVEVLWLPSAIIVSIVLVLYYVFFVTRAVDIRADSTTQIIRNAAISSLTFGCIAYLLRVAIVELSERLIGFIELRTEFLRHDRVPQLLNMFSLQDGPNEFNLDTATIMLVYIFCQLWHIYVCKKKPKVHE